MTASPNIVINKVVRSRRTTLALQINPDGALIVRAPNRLSEKEILGFVTRKRDWILKKQQSVARRQQQTVVHRFLPGERFPFLGEYYNFRFSLLDEQLVLSANEFVLGSCYAPDARKHFVSWYLCRAHDVLDQRIRHWSAMTSLVPKIIKIRDAKTRWGSCSIKGVINLSWRLVMAPMWVVDYVVVHELAHLAVMNHSPRFWNHVAKFIPYYKDARRWLRQNQNTLVL